MVGRALHKRRGAEMRHTAAVIAITFGLALLLPAVGHTRSPSLPKGFEAVTLSVGGERPATLQAYLLRPASVSGPVPAVVALHGCGGLIRSSGRISKRELEWAKLLTADGYAVLFPDSFNPRGYAEICSDSAGSRPIRPRHRAGDAKAALAWLAAQPFIDPERIALIGWSHGGSSTLWAAARGPATASPDFKAAIAFYPGCRPLAAASDYTLGFPLTVLIGSADDWTPPEPCRQFSQRHGARLIEYPDAVHGFDTPNSPRRSLTGVGLSARGDGRVQIGTHPASRENAIAEVRRSLAETFRKGTK